MNSDIQKQIDAISDMENKLITDIEAILVAEGMDVFVQWAKAFPKRSLRFVSGMGTATFACPSLDNSAFLLELDEYCEENTKKVFWSDRAAAMVQPMTDFWNLFWSSDLLLYPAIPDIIYNPVTRTVECGQVIIRLDQHAE